MTGTSRNWGTAAWGVRVEKQEKGNPNRLTLEEMLAGKTLAGIEKTGEESIHGVDTGWVKTRYIQDMTLGYGEVIEEIRQSASGTARTAYTYGLERISEIEQSTGRRSSDDASSLKTAYVYDVRGSVIQRVTVGVNAVDTANVITMANAVTDATAATMAAENALAVANTVSVAGTVAEADAAVNNVSVASLWYTPFGEQMAMRNAKVGEAGTSASANSASPAKASGYGYNGEYYDAAIGMLHLRTRQYEPAMARFSQKDLLRGYKRSALSQNRYTYVLNNPISYIDPSGMITEAEARKNATKEANKACEEYGKYDQAEGEKKGQETYNAYMNRWRNEQQQQQQQQKANEAVRSAEDACYHYANDEVKAQAGYDLVQYRNGLSKEDRAAFDQAVRDRGYDPYNLDGVVMRADDYKYICNQVGEASLGRKVLQEAEQNGGLDLGNLTAEQRWVLEKWLKQQQGVVLTDAIQALLDGMGLWVPGQRITELTWEQVLALANIQWMDDGDVALLLLACVALAGVPFAIELILENLAAAATLGTGIGYETFNKFKEAMGSAGVGNVWHHIVEKSQILKSGFAPTQIHNTINMIIVESGVHDKISGYYSSIQPAISGNMTIRNWLTGQSFEAQYEFGLQVLRKFGVIN